MPLSVKDFWKLVLHSQLLSQEQSEKWAIRGAQALGAAATESPQQVAEWLVGQKVLSRYQASVLLAGRPGPFVYGEYRVYERIDKGRLAGYFRAHHVASRYPVLLEFLTGPAVQDATRWSARVPRLQAECGLRHPHVVRWFELADLDAYKFLVLEELRGQSWEDYVTAKGRLPPAEAARIAREAAEGLAALHAAGSLHGDLRPSNLWTDAGGSTKVLRSGGSLPEPVDVTDPQAAAALADRGDYLAPEFLQPGKAPDVLTEIYALGCTLYRLLTAEVPFPEGSVVEKLQRHATEPIRPLEPLGVPAGLAQVVAYMMAKNPAVRFSQLPQVIEQLAPFAAAPKQPTELAGAKHLPAYEAILAARGPAPPPAAPEEIDLPPSAAAPGPVITAPVAAAPRVTAASSERSAVGAGTITAPAIATSPAAAVAAAPAIRIVTDSPATSVASRPRGRKRTMPLLIGGVVVALVAVSGVVAWVTRPAKTPAVAVPEPAQPSQATAAVNSTPGASPAVTPEAAPAPPSGPPVVPDDGQLLWASPTAGTPIRFDYLPSGAQFVLFVRPAAISASPEGERLLRALGPSFEAVRTKWEQASGFSLAQVESLLVSFFGGDDGEPRPAFVVRLAASQTPAQLLEKWGRPAAKSKGGSTYYEAQGWAFYLPAGEEVQAFAMGLPTEIEDVAERSGAVPPPHRWIERLRLASDDQRHLTAFFTPHDLSTDLLRDGRTWSWGDVNRARNAMEWFLGEGTQAAAFSLHLEPANYLELQVASELGKDRYTLAAELRQRLQEIPSRVEDYMIVLNPHPYWRAVAFRFPGMIRFLHDQTRIGVEEDHAVLNAALPATAAHNLVFGTGMVLSSAPGVVVAAAASPAAGPKNMDEILRHKIDVDIPQQDLVNALVDIEQSVNEDLKNQPFPFKIRMMGTDLMADGITQNQKITDFRMADTPLADVLTGLVRKANPDPAVQDASEPGQKLIWVVAPNPEAAGKPMIVVTTRAAAARDGHSLPAPFQPKP